MFCMIGAHFSWVRVNHPSQSLYSAPGIASPLRNGMAGRG